jgi:uncharacterized membrane protein (DUF485 family)
MTSHCLIVLFAKKYNEFHIKSQISLLPKSHNISINAYHTFYLVIWQTQQNMYGIQTVCKSIFLFQSQFFSLIAVDTSCLSMDKNKIYKKNFWIHYRWPILIFIFIFISTIVLTTIFVIRAKRNSQPSVIHASNTSAKNQTYNVCY